jgi:hypothetical protein
MPFSPLSFVAGVEHQKKTYWDFYFLDNIFFKFRIKSMNLPLPKFEIETRSTWENFYKELSLNTTFDIEIYEDIAFSTYAYFQTWRNLVYDMNTRRFISYVPNTPNPILKTAQLNYYPTGSVIDVPPTKVFTLQNVRFIGLSELANDYEDGSGRVYTVSLAYELLNEI